MNKHRVQTVISHMRQAGLSQILVTSTTSLFYLTGYWVEPHERMIALLLTADGNATLFGNEIFGQCGEQIDNEDVCINHGFRRLRKGIVAASRSLVVRFAGCHYCRDKERENMFQFHNSLSNLRSARMKQWSDRSGYGSILYSLYVHFFGNPIM